MPRKPPPRKHPHLDGLLNYLRERAVAAVTLVVSLSVFVGLIIGVDSFYVRSARYVSDRQADVRQGKITSLDSTIATLETRQAFTRYRLNDTIRSDPNDVRIQEYRSDLFQLNREIDNKKLLRDRLESEKD